MDVLLFSRVTTIFLILFSISSHASVSEIQCSQITEFQPKLIEFNKKSRASSKEYLALKRSSDGWEMEAYLFLGEYNGKYIIAGLGNQTVTKEVTISQTQFYSLINKFQILIKGEQFNVSDTEHNHCTQLIMRTSTLNYNQTKIGLLNNLKFNNVVRELDYYIFL